MKAEERCTLELAAGRAPKGGQYLELALLNDINAFRRVLLAKHGHAVLKLLKMAIEEDLLDLVVQNVLEH